MDGDMTLQKGGATDAPFYLAQGDECALFEVAGANDLPVLLKGPTGCGKTRFVTHMAARLGRPLYTVACHDDLSAADLIGRYLLKGGETVWVDGPLTRAVPAAVSTKTVSPVIALSPWTSSTSPRNSIIPVVML